MYRGNLGLLLITDKNESGRHVSLFLKMLFIFEGGNARKHLQSLPEINRKCFLKKQTNKLSIYLCAVWNFISVGGLKKDLLLSSATHHDSAML